MNAMLDKIILRGVLGFYCGLALGRLAADVFFSKGILALLPVTEDFRTLLEGNVAIFGPLLGASITPVLFVRFWDQLPPVGKRALVGLFWGFCVVIFLVAFPIIIFILIAA